MLYACSYYKVFHLAVKGSVKVEQEAPFYLMSVVSGEGTLNGAALHKGDHFIVPAGFGTMAFAGTMELIASTI